MQPRIQSFLRRPMAEKWLLGRTWLFLLAVRAALVVASFPRVRRWFERWNARPAGRLRDPGDPGDSGRRLRRSTLVWAVRTAGRYVPSSRPCLTQALVLDSYLRRRGYPSRIALGVARGEGRLEAHAWVESDGQVVLGGEDLSRYVELRSSDPSGPFS